MLVDEKVKSKDQIVQDLSLSASDIEKISELPFGYIRNISEVDQPTFKKEDSKILPFKR